MSDRLIARRYAIALRDFASTANALEKVDADVAIVAETVANSSDLSLFFASPIVSREKKRNVVKALFGKHVGNRVLDFLLLLIEKGREQSITEITTAYRELRDEQEGIVEASARTAERMTADDETRLRKALEDKTGKKVRLKVHQDLSVLGGVVVRIGDLVYDGTVRNSLAHLREQFGRGAISSN